MQGDYQSDGWESVGVVVPEGSRFQLQVHTPKAGSSYSERHESRGLLDQDSLWKQILSEGYEQKHKEGDRLKKANKKKIKIPLERNLVSRPN